MTLWLLFGLLVVYLLGQQSVYENFSSSPLTKVVLQNEQDRFLHANAFQAKPLESGDQGSVGGLDFSEFNPMGYHRRKSVKNYYQQRLSTKGL